MFECEGKKVKDDRDFRRRITVDIPTFIYKKMKISTVNRNCTLTKWLIRAILDRLKNEDEVK